MPLFHCTHKQLESGVIIQPGNWGRIILNQGETHPSWEREQVLERIRVGHYPEKPSRLKSAYCCETIEAAKCYKEKNIPQGYIYEVNIIEETQPSHRGDFNCLEPLPRRPENMEEIAHLYWKYALKTSVQEWPGVVCSEIVTLSGLKVLGLVN